MDKKTQKSASHAKDSHANYNPTARNFDEEDVAGSHTSINSREHHADDRDEDLDPEPEEVRGKDTDKA